MQFVDYNVLTNVVCTAMLIKTVNIVIQTTNIKTGQIYKIIIVTDTIKSVPNLVIICFILTFRQIQ